MKYDLRLPYGPKGEQPEVGAKCSFGDGGVGVIVEVTDHDVAYVKVNADDVAKAQAWAAEIGPQIAAVNQKLAAAREMKRRAPEIVQAVRRTRSRVSS